MILFEVEAIYAEDPFWTGGLRRSVKVRHRSQASEGKRPIQGQSCGRPVVPSGNRRVTWPILRPGRVSALP